MMNQRMFLVVSFKPSGGRSENSRALELFHMSWSMRKILATGWNSAC